MNVLITGSNGFIGKNLICHLKQIENVKILEYSRNNSISDLARYISEADIVFHLAGATRPKDETQFKKDNTHLTKQIVDLLSEQKKSIPIIFTSSIQVVQHNFYGITKKESEELIIDYSRRMQTSSYIFQLPNVFGKWSLPNYNSVVATWCHNISRGMEISISDPEANLTLVYVDDVVDSFLSIIKNFKEDLPGPHYPTITRKFQIKLKDLSEKIYNFKNSNFLPDSSDTFTNFLHATFLSHLPEDGVSSPLKVHSDKRGSFFEVFKSMTSGQISISTSKPGAVRGNHFHHTKCEKFVVIQGEALIKLRKIDEKKELVYSVSGANPSIVNILPGYTHNIENTGSEDMILLMWANEIYDPKAPDTTPREV